MRTVRPISVSCHVAAVVTRRGTFLLDQGNLAVPPSGHTPLASLRLVVLLSLRDRGSTPFGFRVLLGIHRTSRWPNEEGAISDVIVGTQRLGVD